MYFLNKGTPWVLQVLPSLLPSSGRRASSFLAAHYSNTCTDWVCFMLLRQHYIRAVRATPRSCFILATPSLPNFMPLGFHSTINLLLSMEVSRSWWGNPPLAWADHFFSAISPWWARQSYHACTLKWSWCSPNGTGVGGGRGPVFGFSECVGLGSSRLKAICFLSMLACDSG